MILLHNVKITNIPLNAPPNRGRFLNKPDRIDIWKYALASYVPLIPLLSKIIIFATFENTENVGKEAESEKYIRFLFPEDKLILNWYRLNTQKDWQKACDEIIFPIDDEIIFNVTNDDHIFIDSNLEILKEGIKLLKNTPNWDTQLIYSHWPEQMRTASEWNWSRNNNYFLGIHREFHGVDICKKERWKHYWFSQDLGNESIYFRPEMLQHKTNMFPNGNFQIVPMKEQFRHFDGYEHAGNCLNTVPPLEIPSGFFNNDIKISYGYDYYLENWVNINPNIENLKAYHQGGFDYKISLRDIPLFWENKISKININDGADLEILREKRDEHLYKMVSSHIIRFIKPPLFMETFKNFYLSKKYGF